MNNETRPKGLMISEMFSKTAQSENINNFQMVPIEKLTPFFDHPFRPYTDAELDELVESIKEIGIMHPIVARKIEDGKFEILSGHNRTVAAKKVGLRDVPVKILIADDDTAKMIVTETNLKQREKIPHSDKAKAYKMQLDALKNQGKRKGLLEEVEKQKAGWSDGPQAEEGPFEARWTDGPQVKSRDIVADMNNTSAKQISRYIRLNHLEPGLLEKVDSERIAFQAGVELSYLNKELQDKLSVLLDTDEKLVLNVQKAKALRALPEAQGSCFGLEALEAILRDRQQESKAEKIKKYVPFKTIFKAAEKQFKKVDPNITARLDEKKLEGIVVEAIQNYLAELD